MKACREGLSSRPAEEALIEGLCREGLKRRLAGKSGREVLPGDFAEMAWENSHGLNSRLAEQA